VFFQAVDRGDIRMIQCCERARLALESNQALGIRTERRGQHLQSHVAAEPRIVRAVHLTHSADANQIGDAKRAELRASRKSHESESR
jgi:hypothetical protein